MWLLAGAAALYVAFWLSTTLVGLILQSLTVGLFTLYLVADGPRLRRDGLLGAAAR